MLSCDHVSALVAGCCLFAAGGRRPALPLMCLPGCCMPVTWQLAANSSEAGCPAVTALAPPAIRWTKQSLYEARPVSPAQSTCLLPACGSRRPWCSAVRGWGMLAKKQSEKGLWGSRRWSCLY